MCPQSDWKPIHKYQHFYAWFLYGLLTFVWIIFKDFVGLIKYQKDGIVKKQKASVIREWVILILTKIIYIGYTFVVPLYLISFSFAQIFVVFFFVHSIAA